MWNALAACSKGASSFCNLCWWQRGWLRKTWSECAKLVTFQLGGVEKSYLVKQLQEAIELEGKAESQESCFSAYPSCPSIEFRGGQFSKILSVPVYYQLKDTPTSWRGSLGARRFRKRTPRLGTLILDGWEEWLHGLSTDFTHALHQNEYTMGIPTHSMYSMDLST